MAWGPACMTKVCLLASEVHHFKNVNVNFNGTWTNLPTYIKNPCNKLFIQAFIKTELLPKHHQTLIKTTPTEGHAYTSYSDGFNLKLYVSHRCSEYCALACSISEFHDLFRLYLHISVMNYTLSYMTKKLEFWNH